MHIYYGITVIVLKFILNLYNGQLKIIYAVNKREWIEIDWNEFRFSRVYRKSDWNPFPIPIYFYSFIGIV